VYGNGRRVAAIDVSCGGRVNMERVCGAGAASPFGALQMCPADSEDSQVVIPDPRVGPGSPGAPSAVRCCPVWVEPSDARWP